MSLKFSYDNVEDVPEGLVNLYTETDGKFTLGEIDGMVAKTKVDSFRDNNINLRKEIESNKDSLSEALENLEAIKRTKAELEEKFSGVDLEAYKESQRIQKEIEDKELIKSGDVDTLISSRVDEVLKVKQKEIDDLKSSQEEKVKGLETSVTSYNDQLKKLLVDNEITKASALKGVRPSAVDDVIARSRGIFRVEDGKVSAYDGEGRVIYSDDAVTPLSIDGWMSQLTKSAPHLFESSQGGDNDQNSGDNDNAGDTSNGSMTPEEMIKAGLGNL
jgi:hypothetical protein